MCAFSRFMAFCGVHRVVGAGGMWSFGHEGSSENCLHVCKHACVCVGVCVHVYTSINLRVSQYQQTLSRKSLKLNCVVVNCAK